MNNMQACPSGIGKSSGALPAVDEYWLYKCQLSAVISEHQRLRAMPASADACSYSPAAMQPGPDEHERWSHSLR